MTSPSPVRVLVLCAGNIGRSPLAAALLEQAMARKMAVPIAELPAAGVSICSAGTAASEGHEASQRGVAFAAERGVDLTGHRAALLTADLVQEADVIFAMDRNQIVGVSKFDLDAVARTLLWAGEGSEIPDPHHESDAFFVDVGVRIEAAVPAIVAELAAIIESRSVS